MLFQRSLYVVGCGFEVSLSHALTLEIFNSLVETINLSCAYSSYNGKFTVNSLHIVSIGKLDSIERTI